MKTSGMDIRNHKKRGQWAELRFMTKATELGFQAAKPLGDSAQYDVVLDIANRAGAIVRGDTHCLGNVDIQRARQRSHAHQLQKFTSISIFHVSASKIQELIENTGAVIAHGQEESYPHTSTAPVAAV